MTESKMTLREASNTLHLNYSSAKSVIHTYKSMGRILRTGNTQEKPLFPASLCLQAGHPSSVALPRVLPLPTPRPSGQPIVQCSPLPRLALLQPPTALVSCNPSASFSIRGSLPSLGPMEPRSPTEATHETSSLLLPPQAFNFKLYDEVIVGSCRQRFQSKGELISRMGGKRLPPPRCLLSTESKRGKTLDDSLM